MKTLYRIADTLESIAKNLDTLTRMLSSQVQETPVVKDEVPVKDIDSSDLDERKHKRWTPKELKTLRECRKKGISMTETASLLGRSPYSCASQCRNMGWTGRGRL